MKVKPFKRHYIEEGKVADFISGLIQKGRQFISSIVSKFKSALPYSVPPQYTIDVENIQTLAEFARENGIEVNSELPVSNIKESIEDLLDLSNPEDEKKLEKNVDVVDLAMFGATRDQFKSLAFKLKGDIIVVINAKNKKPLGELTLDGEVKSGNIKPYKNSKDLFLVNLNGEPVIPVSSDNEVTTKKIMNQVVFSLQRAIYQYNVGHKNKVQGNLKRGTEDPGRMIHPQSVRAIEENIISKWEFPLQEGRPAACARIVEGKTELLEIKMDQLREELKKSMMGLPNLIKKGKAQKNPTSQQIKDMVEGKKRKGKKGDDDSIVISNSKIENKIGLSAYKGLFYNKEADEFQIINTCPNAKDCKAFCFAAKGSYVQYDVSGLSMARKLSYLVNNTTEYFDQIVREVNAIIEKYKGIGIPEIRWHDSGDFYSEKYVQLAFSVADRTKGANHYAYTKQVELIKSLKHPENFLFNYSMGGEQNERIDFSNDKISVVLGQQLPKGLYQMRPYPGPQNGNLVLTKSQTYEIKLVNNTDKQLGKPIEIIDKKTGKLIGTITGNVSIDTTSKELPVKGLTITGNIEPYFYSGTNPEEVEKTIGEAIQDTKTNEVRSNGFFVTLSNGKTLFIRIAGRMTFSDEGANILKDKVINTYALEENQEPKIGVAKFNINKDDLMLYDEFLAKYPKYDPTNNNTFLVIVPPGYGDANAQRRDVRVTFLCFH